MDSTRAATDASNQLPPARPVEDVAYELYDFGAGVEVVGASGWSRDGSSTLTRAVFVRFDDDLPDTASTRITFKAYLADGVVQEAYALTPKGDLLGRLPSAEL